MQNTLEIPSNGWLESLTYVKNPAFAPSSKIPPLAPRKGDSAEFGLSSQLRPRRIDFVWMNFRHSAAIDAALVGSE